LLASVLFAAMLLPLVDANANDANVAETISKLSVLSFVAVQLPRATLDALAPVDNAALDEAHFRLKRALLTSRSIAGPFGVDMMATAISWLDQGLRKVLVNAESMEDSELQRVATAMSELPANRVVLRVAVDVELLVANPVEIQSKLQRLQETIGGVIVSLRSSSALDFQDDVTYQTQADAVHQVRSGFDEGFLFAVEWQHALDQLTAAAEVPRLAALHHKGIHVVASALPQASDADSKSIDAGLAFVACLRSDRPDGLFTTVVADEAGVALGLVYSSTESVLAAIRSGRGVYYSRSRQGLWKKGESSGNAQLLLQLDVDCDSDALRFTVRQSGAGFCHLNTRTCWGESGGLQHLQSQLASRLEEAPEGSYTKRLFNDPMLLRNKLVEEAQELAEAESHDDVAGEAADVMYFAMVRCVAAGVTIADIEVRC
jgi:phosphoribosyl-ATP pyrophosphohydrolase / phosphoribosyl-AMP cyclohydrolase / histidinol dehydrogenase